MAILAVNAGSSSLKFSLHPLQDGHVQPFLLSGNIHGLEPNGAPCMDWTYLGKKHSEPLKVTEGSSPFSSALRSVRALIARLEGAEGIDAIAHRVVHGGGVYSGPVLVNDEVLQKLSSFNSLAPLHQRHNVHGIEEFIEAFPHLPQVACFDTAFHAQMPEIDYAFALPQVVRDMGVRRYGFHGLSYQYVMSVLEQESIRGRGRVVMAHLGNGASLSAAIAGRGIATTMGFSALDGLMMGTRCGSLDAGVLLYLLEQGWTHAQIQKLLYKESGLLGVSGISADMRTLRTSNSPNAVRAIEQFTHRIIRETGAMVACLGGIDVLAFSGGIGENDAELRAEVCQKLAWLGIRMDPKRNAEARDKVSHAIHAPDSSVEVWVIPTDEGRVAAREAAAILEQLKAAKEKDVA